MEWGITFLGELEKMKEEMDRKWNDLFEGNPGKKRRRYRNGLRNFQNSKGQEEGVQNHGQAK